MQLQNQNNQNLTSSVNQLLNKIKQSGKNPKQIVMDMLQKGEISQNDLERAKRFAESNLNFFNK